MALARLARRRRRPPPACSPCSHALTRSFCCAKQSHHRHFKMAAVKSADFCCPLRCGACAGAFFGSAACCSSASSSSSSRCAAARSACRAASNACCSRCCRASRSISSCRSSSSMCFCCCRACCCCACACSGRSPSSSACCSVACTTRCSSAAAGSAAGVAAAGSAPVTAARARPASPDTESRLMRRLHKGGQRAGCGVRPCSQAYRQAAPPQPPAGAAAAPAVPNGRHEMRIRCMEAAGQPRRRFFSVGARSRHSPAPHLTPCADGPVVA